MGGAGVVFCGRHFACLLACDDEVRVVAVCGCAVELWLCWLVG